MRCTTGPILNASPVPFPESAEVEAESFPLTPLSSQVLGPAVLLEDAMLPDYNLAAAFWGLELLLDPTSS